jgi:hypothetical protein
MRYFLSLFLFNAILMTGCATTRFPTWNNSAHARVVGSSQESTKLEFEADALFEKRKDLQNLEAALLKWDLALKMTPSQQLSRKLARAHFLYAERTLDAEHYTKGLGCAETGLKFAAPVLVEQVKKGVHFTKAVEDAPKEAAAVLYWYALNLEKWALSQGILTSLRYRESVKAAIVKVLHFDNDIESYAQLSDSMNESAR